MPDTTPETQSTPRPEGSQRPDASMTLLTSMFERPLDPSYAEAAATRRAAGLPGATSHSTPLTMVSALLIGFLLAAGALALRPPQVEGNRAKAKLVERVEKLQAANATSEGQVSTLQSEVRALEAAALGSGPGTAKTRSDSLAVPSGTVAVTGPGLVLAIDDPPGTKKADGSVNPREDGGFGDRITSADLQVVTNGLWAAGAEAIAINGQRISSRTAIRFAGQAVLVNYRALNPPYRIEVVGDAAAIEKSFRSGPSGPYLGELETKLKAAVSWERRDTLNLPADAGARTTKAQATRGRTDR